MLDITTLVRFGLSSAGRKGVNGFVPEYEEPVTNLSLLQSLGLVSQTKRSETDYKLLIRQRMIYCKRSYSSQIDELIEAGVVVGPSK
jgi:hypothetical protein